MSTDNSTESDSITIGIDLGTTHCCVAYMNKNGTVDVIANKDGYRTTPSYIVLTDTGILVGKIAKEEYFTTPENVVYDSKRLIGRNFYDKCVQRDMKSWSFKVKDNYNRPLIELSLGNEPVCYKPEEISAMLLDNMKCIAEEYIGKPVKNAVITVPAHFNYFQRTTTAEAGKLAGLNVLGIINEPTAAALAYVHKNCITDSKNILVFDLGGGTCDVSVVKVESNAVTVVATGGNTHLGGRDFDNNLVEMIFKIIKEKYGKSALDSDMTKRRIRAASENLKIRLSTVEKAVFDLQCLNNQDDVLIQVTREQFEEVNLELFQATIEIVKNCVIDAKLKKKDIDEVVLVGGSVRIPKIQQMLSEIFGGKTLSKAINPDEAIGYGAAVKAAKFNNCVNTASLTKIIDITPLSLGIREAGGLMCFLIRRNSTIPTSATSEFCSVYDQQRQRCWSIYEGERLLAKDNIYLGKCSLRLPPKPPGHAVELTFYVDENGILQLTARDKSGLHKTLTIFYEGHDPHNIKDIIRDATINKPSDKRKKVAARKWILLLDCCIRLKAVCDYDKKNMTSEDKDKIKDTAGEILQWAEYNQVIYGNEDEVAAIDKKLEQLSEGCNPIISKYGFDVKTLENMDEFHKIIEFES